LRLAARSALIALVISSMLNLPVMAAAKPVGMVVSAENAHLGELNLAMGTNLFPGDFLQTDPNGTLRLKVGSAQVYLGPGSAAVLEQQADKVGAKLTRGTVGFSSAPASGFAIDTFVASVRPAKDGGFGEVTIVGPRTILVAAYRGSLIVSGTGIERTIPEGNSFNVTLAADADPQGPQGAEGGNGGNGSSRQRTTRGVANHDAIIFTAVVLGAAAGGAYAAWHFTTESDPTPH
jgi:hypothetical protein